MKQMPGVCPGGMLAAGIDSHIISQINMKPRTLNMIFVSIRVPNNKCKITIYIISKMCVNTKYFPFRVSVHTATKDIIRRGTDIAGGLESL